MKKYAVLCHRGSTGSCEYVGSSKLVAILIFNLLQIFPPTYFEYEKGKIEIDFRVIEEDDG